MPRHIRHRDDRAKATASLEAFLGPTPKKHPTGRAVARIRKKHIAEVRDRWARKHWDGMTAGKLVALYWLCHEKVYGVVPVEIDRATTWEQVMKIAGSMVKRHFDDDVERAVVFMRWVWTREQGREKWRRDNKRDGYRLTWRNQFSQDYLITDWRAAAMRA